jgi:uncharacterized protein YpmS
MGEMFSRFSRYLGIQLWKWLKIMLLSLQIILRCNITNIRRWTGSICAEYNIPVLAIQKDKFGVI